MTEREKQQHREQQRRYYARHPEKCATMTKLWLEKNPGYVNQDARDRYMLNPEPKKKRSRAYYWKNRERINAVRRAARLHRRLASAKTAIRNTGD